MATLRPCPSGLVVGALSISSSSSFPPRFAQPLGRRSTSSLQKMSAARITAPSVHHRHAIHAQNGAVDWPVFLDPDDKKPMTEEEFNKFREELKKHCELDKDMPFREDIEQIDEYWKKMTSWNTSIFHMRATALSLHLCMVVKKGVKLASRIRDSAVLRHDKQDEISLHTTKQTVMS